MSEGSVGYYDSSSVLTELSAGVSGTVLTMGASLPAWSVAGGFSSATQSASLASGQWTTSSSTAVAVTGMEITCGGTGGLVIANCNASINDAVSSRHGIWIASAGSVQTDTGAYSTNATNVTNCNNTSLSIARASQTITAYGNTEGGTVAWNGDTAQGGCNLMVSELY